MTSELTLRIQNKNGNFDCERYKNFPAPKSAHLAICYTDNAASEQMALDLKQELVKGLSKIEKTFTKFPTSCRGNNRSLNNCHALSISTNEKLLVGVTDGLSDVFVAPSVLQWKQQSLPIVPTGMNVTLPNPFAKPNAAFWTNNISEALLPIFHLIGVSQEEQKVFISYRRKDTSDLADQLFDRLTHEGFDVFLDRFSIKPGIDFQDKLYQALADKAMVIFLESTDFLTSQWINYEIAFTKKYRLGYLAVNIDNAPKAQAINNSFRETVTLNPAKLLDSIDLNHVVNKIKEQHTIALYRKKIYLNTNIKAALRRKKLNPTIDVNGFISVSGKKGRINNIVGTTRPPILKNYYHLDINNLKDTKIIVGPEFIENNRGILNTWLSQKSDIQFFNEGDLLNLMKFVNS